MPIWATPVGLLGPMITADLTLMHCRKPSGKHLAHGSSVRAACGVDALPATRGKVQKNLLREDLRGPCLQHNRAFYGSTDTACPPATQLPALPASRGLIRGGHAPCAGVEPPRDKAEGRLIGQFLGVKAPLRSGVTQLHANSSALFAFPRFISIGEAATHLHHRRVHGARCWLTRADVTVACMFRSDAAVIGTHVLAVQPAFPNFRRVPSPSHRADQTATCNWCQRGCGTDGVISSHTASAARDRTRLAPTAALAMDRTNPSTASAARRKFHTKRST